MTTFFDRHIDELANDACRAHELISARSKRPGGSHKGVSKMTIAQLFVLFANEIAPNDRFVNAVNSSQFDAQSYMLEDEDLMVFTDGTAAYYDGDVWDEWDEPTVIFELF